MPNTLKLPSSFILEGELIQQLRYGENPHQSAALYRSNSKRPGVLRAAQKQGKELSYNNILDADAAFECVADLDPKLGAACVIVKHQTPCGAAQGGDLCEEFARARDCDRNAAFGGVVAFNETLYASAAREILKGFVEVVIAPNISPSALEVFLEKPSIRVLVSGSMPDQRSFDWVVRTVAGGFVVQTRDRLVEQCESKVVTNRQPTAAELTDLEFAWRIAKHVKSNAIVYAKDRTTVGIGGGQVSRVGAARIGATNAEALAHGTDANVSPAVGSVAASDAFFPFADGLETIVATGATAVIQPGGSVRDQEVIDAANKAGIAMIFTGVRHFRH
jgi:phosphoribosylaminoimidazolecarboxamide formyltransferase/IMP cyclohydrolase